jgi:hypothetical protein
MKQRSLLGMLVLLGALVTLVAGCAGTAVDLGSPPLAGIGEITPSDPANADGSHRWVSRFTAVVTGTTEVQMLQGGVDWLLDPYVMVFEGDYGIDEIPPLAALVASDDNSGPGNSALATFDAVVGRVYTVWFTTYGPDDFGTFVYDIYDYTNPTTNAVEPSDSAKPPVPPSAKLGQG